MRQYSDPGAFMKRVVACGQFQYGELWHLWKRILLALFK
jgi:hypothetical protein